MAYGWIKKAFGSALIQYVAKCRAASERLLAFKLTSRIPRSARMLAFRLQCEYIDVNRCYYEMPTAVHTHVLNLCLLSAYNAYE